MVRQQQQKKVVKVTPAGIAMFPHLRKAEEWQGNVVGLTVKLSLKDSDVKAFEAMLEDELAKVSSLPEFAGRDFSQANLPIGTTSKDNVPFIKFKAQAGGTTRDGREWKRVIPLYDSQGKGLDESVDVYHGDTIAVAYSIIPYWISRRNCGLSLRIEAVQLIERKKQAVQSDNGSRFGFGVVSGGYVSGQEDNVDVPAIPDVDESDFASPVPFN